MQLEPEGADAAGAGEAVSRAQLAAAEVCHRVFAAEDLVPEGRLIAAASGRRVGRRCPRVLAGGARFRVRRVFQRVARGVLDRVFRGDLEQAGSGARAAECEAGLVRDQV
jgi:hypothetical protein